MDALPVVLDTNVCLDLLLFQDPRCGALAAGLQQGRLRACADHAIAEEWRRVLQYALWQLEPARQLSLQQSWQALHHIQVDSGAADPRLPRCRDADDQKFLELAARARAYALVSKDRDLLGLARRCRRAGLFHILPPDAFALAWPEPLPAPVRASF